MGRLQRWRSSVLGATALTDGEELIVGTRVRMGARRTRKNKTDMLQRDVKLCASPGSTRVNVQQLQARRA